MIPEDLHLLDETSGPALTCLDGPRVDKYARACFHYYMCLYSKQLFHHLLVRQLKPPHYLFYLTMKDIAHSTGGGKPMGVKTWFSELKASAVCQIATLLEIDFANPASKSWLGENSIWVRRDVRSLLDRINMLDESISWNLDVLGSGCLLYTSPSPRD